VLTAGLEVIKSYTDEGNSKLLPKVGIFVPHNAIQCDSMAADHKMDLTDFILPD
jgi:hypothetical protein